MEQREMHKYRRLCWVDPATMYRVKERSVGQSVWLPGCGLCRSRRLARQLEVAREFYHFCSLSPDANRSPVLLVPIFFGSLNIKNDRSEEAGLTCDRLATLMFQVGPGLFCLFVWCISLINPMVIFTGKSFLFLCVETRHR